MRTILALLIALPLSAQTLDQRVQRELPSLLQIYRTLHAAPELSMKEEKSSALVAAWLRELGYTVTERVGKYRDASATSYGVVGVMKNGDGPTVLVRSDMDGLPVPEQTGLPYASQNAGVMHACGHDIHMTTLLGTAKMLSDMKSQWRGTVMMIGQPAEEVVQGANAMLGDRLYERFGRPNYAVAIHDWALLPAGKVGYRAGYIMANSDSVDITVRGIGGHGAAPQNAKDPILIASEIVVALQKIVSREGSPLDPVVVTVGSMHAGAKRNIIPDEAKLFLTVRTYKPEVRARVLSSIERIAKGIAMAAGVPDDRAPIVEVHQSESADATYNDPPLTNRLVAAVRREVGDANVVEIDPSMVGEDFGRFGLNREIPTSMLLIGASDPALFTTGAPVPGLHSSKFAPAAEPTLRTAVRTLTTAVMELLRSSP